MVIWLLAGKDRFENRLKVAWPTVRTKLLSGTMLMLVRVPAVAE